MSIFCSGFERSSANQKGIPKAIHFMSSYITYFALIRMPDAHFGIQSSSNICKSLEEFVVRSCCSSSHCPDEGDVDVCGALLVR